jgi:MFS family permease
MEHPLHMNGAIDKRESLTFFYENWRALAGGVLETFSSTFLLVLAVDYFKAGDLTQAILATGGAAGFLLSPLTVWLCRITRLPVARAMALLALAGASCFALAAMFPTLGVYSVCALGELVAVTSMIPLASHLYQHNYPDQRRGHLFAWTAIIRVMSSAIFAQGAGWILSQDISRGPALLWGFALAFGFSAYCLAKCPSLPLKSELGHYPYRSLRLIKHNSRFTLVLASWMLLGFGNLMLLPLRVKVLVDPHFGFDYSAQTVALLTATLPCAAHVLSGVMWGKLFDRMNFFTVRATLNFLFAASAGVYFLSNSFGGLCVGALLYGATMSGGNIAWTLCVSKLAPPAEVADYMSVHTFTTGIRAFLAPLIAVPLSVLVPLSWIVWPAILMMILSVVLFSGELTTLRPRKQGTPLTRD